MNDETEAEHTPTLRDRISDWIGASPETRTQLLRLLRKTHQRGLINAESLSMIEGVLQVGELTARDVMVQRSRMDIVDLCVPLETLIRFVIDTGHSRFPVTDGDRDRIVGILHTKDLLKIGHGRPIESSVEAIRDLVRPAMFVPESKKLNLLLHEFRANRKHLALVIDEYGGVAGLVTIEDVLEEIVGEIEDEFDLDDAIDHITPEPVPEGEAGTGPPAPRRFRVHALTSIDEFNGAFGTHFPDQSFDTVGGLVADHFGRIPRRGESIVIENIRFEVVRADPRSVHLLIAESLPESSDPPLADGPG